MRIKPMFIMKRFPAWSVERSMAAANLGETIGNRRCLHERTASGCCFQVYHHSATVPIASPRPCRNARRGSRTMPASMPYPPDPSWHTFPPGEYAPPEPAGDGRHPARQRREQTDGGGTRGPDGAVRVVMMIDEITPRIGGRSPIPGGVETLRPGERQRRGALRRSPPATGQFQQDGAQPRRNSRLPSTVASGLRHGSAEHGRLG